MNRREFLSAAGALALIPVVPRGASAAPAPHPLEAPFLAKAVAAGTLPPVGERLPKEPLVVDMPASGRVTGEYGGEMVTLIARQRDLRYLSANAYARLVGYDENLDLVPDILLAVESDGERSFTLRLRPGHRWSNGAPFTSEDFRYYWEDIALNKELSPAGPPAFLLVDGERPKVEFPDATTVRYAWTKANPRFLPTLAEPRDPFIYRPSAFLKPFHAKYGDKEALKEKAAKAKLKSWAALHNRIDEMFDNSNPELPTLLPWRSVVPPPTSRYVFERNPYYHRIDQAGHQLPYIDRVIVDTAAPGLFAAKSNAGEVDILSRGLNMGDIPVLKQGEKAKGYRTLLWRVARGSEVALYPNLTVDDPVWRALNRDVRYRRALSLAIDRHTINNALLFGLGQEGNNTVREGSRLFREDYRSRWARYDPGAASRLLDEAGLAHKGGNGIRLLGDGRPLEIVVEVDSDTGLAVDTLELIGEFWREVGVKLFIKPQERTILRNRSYGGQTVMVASAGFDNAIPTAVMAPDELAPVHQDFYAWPRWGQYVETAGKSGEAADLPEAQRLLALYEAWLSTADRGEQARIWHEMLANHADQQWSIGTVAGALQPIVLRNELTNLPKEALYSWQPTSLIGIYRIDEIFWASAERRGTQTQ